MAHPIHDVLTNGRKPVVRLFGVMILLMVVLAQGSEAATGQITAGDGRPPGWTRWLDSDLSRQELGLAAGASAPQLARAALDRRGERLGLRHTARSLRLARNLSMPPRQGAGASRAAFPADRRRAAGRVEPDRRDHRRRRGKLDRRHGGAG